MTDQGSEYANFIQAALSREYTARDLVNSRAGTSITSATGLVTLTLAVVAVFKGQQYTLHGGALAALTAALICLFGAGALAVLAGINWRYTVASTATMHMMLAQPHWLDDEVDARNQVAYTNVETIDTLRHGTTIKYRLLLAAWCAQVAAIIALSTTVLIVIN